MGDSNAALIDDTPPLWCFSTGYKRSAAAGRSLRMDSFFTETPSIEWF